MPEKTASLLPARAGPLIFPGLAPRVRRGGRRGGKSNGLCFYSRSRSMVPRRAFPTGGHAGPPLRKVRASQRFVGADLCVGPCPAREGQRQRKEKLHVSLISPGQGFPKGSAFPSLTAARERQPSPAGGRRSALARTDPPKRFFSLDRPQPVSLFGAPKREMGGGGHYRPPVNSSPNGAHWGKPPSRPNPPQWVPPSGSSLFPPDVVQYPHLSFRKERL